MLENLQAMIFDMGLNIVQSLKQIVTVVVIIVVLLVFVFVFFVNMKRYMSNRDLENELQQILKKGAINVRKNKLRNLYTSLDNSNLHLEGKIVAYVQVLDVINCKSRNSKPDLKTKITSSIFAVRKDMLGATIFFKIPFNRHSKLFGDMVLYDWNFKLKSDKYYVINTDDYLKPVKYKGKEIGVDTLGKIAPLIAKSIKANYAHNMRMRESKLIKVPGLQGEAPR